MGSLATGVAATTGSAAFSSVSAARPMTVSVASDSESGLQLQPCPDHEDSYIYDTDFTEVDDGTIKMHFSVNGNAYTCLFNTFCIANHSGQNLKVWITDDGPNDDLCTFFKNPGNSEGIQHGGFLQSSEGEGSSNNNGPGGPPKCFPPGHHLEPDEWPPSDSSGTPPIPQVAQKIKTGNRLPIGIRFNTSDHPNPIDILRGKSVTIHAKRVPESDSD